MRILYDHQIFTWQTIGGISRYFVELMNNFPKECEVVNTTLFTNNVYALNGLINKNHMKAFIPSIEFKGKVRIQRLINQANTQQILRHATFDIFHPTYYDPYFIQRINKPYVITVYDLIHEKFPQFFGMNDKTISNKEITIRNASKIIVISEQTKKDLVEFYGIGEGKIDVIYLGHSIDTSKEEIIRSVPRNYILFVGERGGYKNFDNFIQAFSLINDRCSMDLHLICTGKIFTEAELLLIDKYHLRHKCHHFFVSDAQLTFLYKNARCFVFPSLYEGFGIPILEAFACECPIALSNTSCFPEIAQTGGTYFDPYDPDSMANAIIKLLENIIYREEQIKQGKDILKQYSWQKMANKTLKVYEKL